MSAIRSYCVEGDLEGGSAFALFLAAAGYDVESQFVDGAVLISVDAVDPEIDLELETPWERICQLQERLSDPACIAKGSWESACVRNPAGRVYFGYLAWRRLYDAETIRVECGTAARSGAGVVASRRACGAIGASVWGERADAVSLA
jgi:hypothetical protein